MSIYSFFDKLERKFGTRTLNMISLFLLFIFFGMCAYGIIFLEPATFIALAFVPIEIFGAKLALNYFRKKNYKTKNRSFTNTEMDGVS